MLTSPPKKDDSHSFDVGKVVSILSDARSFSGLTSNIPPFGSMLNLDVDVKETTARHPIWKPHNIEANAGIFDVSVNVTERHRQILTRRPVLRPPDPFPFQWAHLKFHKVYYPWSQEPRSLGRTQIKCGTFWPRQQPYLRAESRLFFAFFAPKVASKGAPSASVRSFVRWRALHRATVFLRAPETNTAFCVHTSRTAVEPIETKQSGDWGQIEPAPDTGEHAIAILALVAYLTRRHPIRPFLSWSVKFTGVRIRPWKAELDSPPRKSPPPGGTHVLRPKSRGVGCPFSVETVARWRPRSRQHAHVQAHSSRRRFLCR